MRSPHTHAGHLQPRPHGGDLTHLAPPSQGTSSLWAAPAPEDSPSSPGLVGPRHRYTTRAAKAATGGAAPSLAPPEEEGSGDSGSGLPPSQPAASKRGEVLSARLGDFQTAGWQVMVGCAAPIVHSPCTPSVDAADTPPCGLAAPVARPHTKSSGPVLWLRCSLLRNVPKGSNSCAGQALWVAWDLQAAGAAAWLQADRPPAIQQVSRVGHRQCAGTVESHPPHSGELALVRCSCTWLALFPHSMVSRQARQQLLCCCMALHAVSSSAVLPSFQLGCAKPNSTDTLRLRACRGTTHSVQCVSGSAPLRLLL